MAFVALSLLDWPLGSRGKDPNMEYGNLAEWFRSRQPWLGNVAQLAGAFLTACAIFFRPL